MNKNIYQCKTDKTIKSEWGVRGLVFKDFRASLHTHQYYEINIIYAGEGVHTVGEEKYIVSRGDVFMIPPFLPHGYSETKNLDVYHLIFHPDFINEHLEEAMTVEGFTLFTEIEPYLRGNTGVARFLHLNELELNDIEKQLYLIDQNGKYDFGEAIPIKKHTAIKVLYELSMMMYKQTYVSKEKDKYSQQIFQTLEYIHTNFDKKLTVDRLAKNVYLSRSTFIRSFQTVCNISPSEYIRQYRKSKALELLNNKDLNKSEVARKCGYYDISHMKHSMNT